MKKGLIRTFDTAGEVSSSYATGLRWGGLQEPPAEPQHVQPHSGQDMSLMDSHETDRPGASQARGSNPA